MVVRDVWEQQFTGGLEACPSLDGDAGGNDHDEKGQMVYPIQEAIFSKPYGRGDAKCKLNIFALSLAHLVT
jgi:hypothetical protein